MYGVGENERSVWHSKGTVSVGSIIPMSMADIYHRPQYSRARNIDGTSISLPINKENPVETLQQSCWLTVSNRNTILRTLTV